jgi:hypothetical protein
MTKYQASGPVQDENGMKRLLCHGDALGNNSFLSKVIKLDKRTQEIHFLALLMEHYCTTKQCISKSVALLPLILLLSSFYLLLL